MSEILITEEKVAAAVKAVMLECSGSLFDCMSYDYLKGKVEDKFPEIFNLDDWDRNGADHDLYRLLNRYVQKHCKIQAELGVNLIKIER